MELIKHIETKTYKVPFFETFDFKRTEDCITSVMNSMPKYSLVRYWYDYDELAFYVVVRRRVDK